MPVATTSVATVTAGTTSVSTVTEGGAVTAVLGLLDESGVPVFDEAAGFILSENGT